MIESSMGFFKKINWAKVDSISEVVIMGGLLLLSGCSAVYCVYLFFAKGIL